MPLALRGFPVFVAAGEALTDLIVSTPDKQSWQSRVGGSTWNVARVMAGLGNTSAFAGAISNDVFGDALVAASDRAGLDPRFLQRVDKSPLLAIVHHTDPPAYFFIGDDSADLQFDAARLPAGWVAQCKWAHFGGISLAREPLAGRLVALAQALKAAGVGISYDPNFRSAMGAGYRPTLQAMTTMANVVKVSDEDLHGLFPEHDTEVALAQLKRWNPGAQFLFTRGAMGAELHVGTERWVAAAPRLAVVDTVGAGDACMGAFIHSVLNRPAQAPLQHVRYAVAAGSCACATAGASAPDAASIAQVLAIDAA